MIPQWQPTFATNLIAKRFDKPWRPDWFVAVSDAPHLTEYYNYFWMGASGAKRGVFITPENWDILGDVNPSTNVVQTYADKPGWVKRGDGNIYCRWGMSHLVSFQLAALMWFKTIYMIGFDGKFKKPSGINQDSCHFTSDYWGEFQLKRSIDYDQMNTDHHIAHSIIRAESDKADFRVINCTPNSAFTMYDYMPFDEAISGV